MKPHAHAPNGVFCDDLILYGAPERGAIAARGFFLETPDLRGAGFARLNDFQSKVRSLLALATPGRRLQFQWSCDSDYRTELLRYHEHTQIVTDPVIRRIRNERFSRYWQRMQDRELRRERLALFLSTEITRYSGNIKTRRGLRAQYRHVLDQIKGQFDEFASTVRGLWAGETTVTPMDDAAHAAFVRRFLNPGLVADRGDVPGTMDPGLTVQENCWHCEGVGLPDGGFTLDGQYHAILTLSRWPQRTWPGIVTHLTGLPFLDYAITVNVVPITTRQEIQKEEKAADRLRGEYASKPRPSLLVALRKKERKVEALSGGFTRPFHVTYLIRAWAPSRDALREKIAAIQSAIAGMDGAQHFECALPTTAKKLFFGSWPGWTHSSYRHRELYAEDAWLADMLPLSATFTGALDRAEAIYDGSHGNLVGVNTNVGGSPQHAVLLGMTGSGKSEVMRDLLLQTGAHYHYTVIIEEGFSYKKFTEELGEVPVVVHPDSPLTLNYLDTQKLPLTQLHLSSAVALLARMVGEAASPEILALRQAQLTQYLHQLYRDAYVSWERRYPDRAGEVLRLACAVHRWREKMPVGSTPLDAFADLRDRKAAGDDEALSFIDGLSDETLTRFSQDPATERFVAHTACAFYTPEEFPTHGALVELLTYAALPEHDRNEIGRLATLLRAWSIDGVYGRLFDGVTTISLQRKVAHFELGFIPEQAVELKAAIGLLVNGLARQHILALPRVQRKRIIFEELSRFLDVPGGEQIVAESYAQLRKFNCWAVSIVQQYARFRSSRIRPAVIGNAKQFFLMRQSDRSDMEDLAGDLVLPETALDAIQRYPLPEQLPPGGKFSSVCYFTPTSQPPQCGTLRHIQAPSDSSHEQTKTAA
ncbi:hypothetical protein OPIT5_22150 [Opitutaceae bacterium TAV5]|nr:hypothetical protein OPIT5_22150 [Opitutaceae bacterium TAV5]